MSTSTATGDWWENIAVYESDYVPSTYSAPASVDANHALLGDLRENEFDFEDTGYSESLVEPAHLFCGLAGAASSVFGVWECWFKDTRACWMVVSSFLGCTY